VGLIIKFAQMEYKYGEAERGRTIFEGIFSNYPKKVDAWSVCIDMELKYNSDLASVRYADSIGLICTVCKYS
jgi:rRNA biogenesis protein RRP5